MMMTPEQPRREVGKKVAQVECKEVEMITYLMDSYERVAQEERMAPKVGVCQFIDCDLLIILETLNYRRSRRSKN